VIPPILCYHKVERRRELGVTRLSPRRFATQLATLARDGWQTIPLSDLTALLRGQRTVGERTIVVTFDDAYRGLRDHAFPVLQDLGFVATCFVITDYAGRMNRWDVAYGGRRFAHLAWRDIETWSGRGISFESHTATHPHLPWVDDRRLVDELGRSRRDLRAALGDAVTAIAYPFGGVDDRVTAAAIDAGYTIGFGVGGRWTGDIMRVPRAAIHCWSPRLPMVGRLGPLERAVSRAVSRCAIGTSLWRNLATMRGTVNGTV
jgi:peptidoglycan/xylan/chitin deacetylase (PgdA/CDA1 family)